MSVALADLRRATLAELEASYTAGAEVDVPTGCYDGVHLAWIDSRGERRTVLRALQWLAFRQVPFGVDFDARSWFFGHPAVAAGRFEATAGPSRWRETWTVRMTYAASRLPGPVRRLLYDEVKPLGSALCLGIGGVDAPRGRGDHFFFALVRR